MDRRCPTPWGRIGAMKMRKKLNSVNSEARIQDSGGTGGEFSTTNSHEFTRIEKQGCGMRDTGCTMPLRQSLGAAKERATRTPCGVAAFLRGVTSAATGVWGNLRTFAAIWGYLQQMAWGGRPPRGARSKNCAALRISKKTRDSRRFEMVRGPSRCFELFSDAREVRGFLASICSENGFYGGGGDRAGGADRKTRVPINGIGTLRGWRDFGKLSRAMEDGREYGDPTWSELGAKGCKKGETAIDGKDSVEI